MSCSHFHRRIVRLAVMAGCLAMAFAIGCTRGEKPTAKQDASKATKASEQKQPAGKEEQKSALPDAREVLEKMVAVYQNAKSYADQGQVRLQAVVGGKEIDSTAPFSLAIERPNKLRMEAYDARIVCDGREMFASVKFIPNQVMRKPAPAKASIKALLTDPQLAQAWTQGFGGAMPQALLLLGEKPMDNLMRDAERVVSLEPGVIGGRECYRVQFQRPDGTAVFWIDRENHILRRVSLPTDAIRQGMSNEGTVENISLTADFIGAELDVPISADAFRFDVPADARVSKYFLPPVMTFLGKKTPPLKFQDLNGKSVDISTLAGKVVVLDFWATWCGPCRMSLPNLDKVYQQFKDNPNVAFYAVSVDEQKMENKALQDKLAEWKVSVPPLRDPDRSAEALQFEGIPTLLVIDGTGVVQHCEMGYDEKMPDELPKIIDLLLSGKSYYESSLAKFEQQMDEYAKEVEASLPDENQSGDGRAVQEHQLPEVKIAPRSEPEKFTLEPLWKCPDLKSPGNILLVADEKGPPRLLVVENWNSVAEVGLDGKLLALHKIDLAEGEVVGMLRSAVGADKKRWTVAFLLSQQRCHLLDADWKTVLHYPEDALQNRHNGIADVQIGDLDGDGKLNFYVAYWGLVGVQGVSLEGKRLWANRSLSEVACIALGGPRADGFRDLYCASGGGEVVVLDSGGQRRGAFAVPGRIFQWILPAKLETNGQLLWCGIDAARPGQNAAVGFSTEGQELWSYPLPPGIHPQPVEQIVPGNVTSDNAGQWLLPGTDGSIHILAADGKFLDKFNYGAALQGLASVLIDGRPVLIVAAADGLQAWKITAK
jgi:thiol-disulfide isomerase/thioredoxin